MKEQLLLNSYKYMEKIKKDLTYILYRKLDFLF